MSLPLKLVRVPSLKTVADFRAHVHGLGLDLPADEEILAGNISPMAQPVPGVTVNGKRIGNRWAVQPMEGWDGTPAGGASEETLRRWIRFGESGAKLICGGEAMAVRPDGRANPNQLVAVEENQGDLARLRDSLAGAHERLHGRADDLVIGFQLTHSGRYCKPHDHFRPEPKVGFRHPLLDRRTQVTGPEAVWSDDDLERLAEDYVRAARLAWEVGADFVDIKHCHGYLLHELLGAFTRPGRYGGSFENRTRLLCDIVAGIRASGNPIDLAVRLSAFDTVPFIADPSLSRPGRPGPGVPEDFSNCLPYRFGFGMNPENPLEYDLTEAHQFIALCGRLGVKIVNLSAGSPYYDPHIQRPAAYPPSDGYQPPEDPLVGVVRQIQAVRQLKARAPQGIAIVGSAYSYLQEYLPHVAQNVVRQGWTDLVGVGRMMLSYPGLVADSLTSGRLAAKSICRTFSDCTTAPRKGLKSGCYPLDPYYAAKPEFRLLKERKA